MLKPLNNKKPIALWGAYHFGNTGDELLLLSAIERIKKEFNNFFILSQNEELGRCLFPEFEIIQLHWKEVEVKKSLFEKFKSKFINFERNYEIYLNNLLSYYQNCTKKESLWLKKLLSSEILYLVGGGYLSDYFNLTPMIFPIFVANKFSIKISSAPITIGPFKSPNMSEFVANQLKSAEIIARDKKTLEFCITNGIKSIYKEDEITNIGSINKKLWVSSKNKNIKKNSLFRIGVNINKQVGSKYNSEIALSTASLIDYIKKNVTNVVFFGFCFFRQESEFETTAHAFRLNKLPCNLIEPASIDFKLNVYRLSHANFIITTRFHAVVLAQVFKIPYVGIWDGEYYEQKMKAANIYTNNPGIIVSSVDIKNHHIKSKILELLKNSSMN